MSKWIAGGSGGALATKADLVSGRVPDDQLPVRLSPTELAAAYGGGAGSTLLTVTRDGVLSVGAGTARLPLGGKAGTIRGVTTALDVAANGPVISDINLNGSTIFIDANDRPSIPAGQRLSAEIPLDVPFTPNSYLTFDIDQVGGSGSPTVYAISDSGTGFNALTTTVTRPVGAQAGDIHVAAVYLTVGGTAGSTTEPPTAVTPPTGWTEFTTPVRSLYNASARDTEMHLYWWRDNGTQTSWTFTPTQPSTGAIYPISRVVTLRGAITTGSPIDAAAQSAPPNSNVSWQAPSLSVSTASTRLLSFFATPNAITGPAVTGQTVSPNSPGGGGGNNGGIYIGHEALSSAGPTGTRTMSGSTGVFSRFVTASVAIKADPSGGEPGEKLVTTIRLELAP